MVNVQELMFRREHFPIELYKSKNRSGENFFSFGRIEVPPYHPSMVEDGIDFQSLPPLLDEIVEAFIMDLEEIADRREDIQQYLQRVIRDETGKVVYEHKIVSQNDFGITLDGVPIIGRVYVGRDRINPSGHNGDQGISIAPGYNAPSFSVPESITFSPELMREYEMEEGYISFSHKKQIDSPHIWHRHNLADYNAILYKNLVIALDNAKIRSLYPNQSPASSN